MNIRNIRTFVPAKDIDVSKQFYMDLGFEVTWEGDSLILFGDENYNFFLQDFYEQVWAENFMLQMHVDNLEALYEKAVLLIEKYENTKIKPIFNADYGRTFHLIDPSGVLWHMTEAKKEK